MAETRNGKLSFLVTFCGFFAALWLLWDTPIVYPLKIFVVLLHEVSHAIAVVATGGRVEAITLDPMQGGATHFVGGSFFLSLNAGYLGSPALGRPPLLGATDPLDSQRLGHRGDRVGGDRTHGVPGAQLVRDRVRDRLRRRPALRGPTCGRGGEPTSPVGPRSHQRPLRDPGHQERRPRPTRDPIRRGRARRAHRNPDRRGRRRVDHRGRSRSPPGSCYGRSAKRSLRAGVSARRPATQRSSATPATEDHTTTGLSSSPGATNSAAAQIGALLGKYGLRNRIRKLIRRAG